MLEDFHIVYFPVSVINQLQRLPEIDDGRKLELNDALSEEHARARALRLLEKGVLFAEAIGIPRGSLPCSNISQDHTCLRRVLCTCNTVRRCCVSAITMQRAVVEIQHELLLHRNIPAQWLNRIYGSFDPLGAHYLATKNKHHTYLMHSTKYRAPHAFGRINLLGGDKRT